MWKSLRSSGIGGKSLEAGVLLAHNAQRRNRAGQKVQSLSGARQNLSSPIRATEVSYKLLAFSAMRVGHIGTPAHWKGPMQIYRRSSGLFHQMGRSRALGYYHRTKVVSREPWCQIMGNNSTILSSWISVPSSESGTTTRPQLIHNPMDKQKSPSEPLKQH